MRSEARRRGRRAAPTGVLLLAAALGCGASPSEPVDLTDLAPVAELATETAEIDFGGAEARPYLVEGFGANEATNAGTRFVWGLADHSVVRIFVGEPRDLELRFRCWPAPARAALAQRLTLRVGGQELGEVALDSRPRWYAVQVPAATLVAGENLVTFDYAQPVGAPGGHAPAVAWERLRIADARSFGPPEVRRTASGAALRLPFYASIAYYLRPPAGSALRFDAIAPWSSTDEPAPSARLEVDVRRAGAPRSEVFDLSAPEAARRSLDLPAADGLPLRITLRAALEGPAPESAAGLDLVRPVLLTPKRRAATHVPPAPARLPDVIVYLIDTLRRDHLGVYGYPRDTSPHLDAFARDATVFENAVAQASWTRPAVASLFTGLNPQSHGVVRPELALPADLPSLPELLRASGYRTVAINTNANIASAFGFGRGFDVFDYLPEDQPVEDHQLSDRVNEAAFSRLEELAGQRPFFLYVHTTDPHAPYAPRAPYRERFAPGVADPAAGTIAQLRRLITGEGYRPGLERELLALYDGEIAFNDASFGAFLAKLEELGLYESSVIVVLSDHGEAFLDHGAWQHGTTLFGEELAIPLIARFPSGRGRVVRDLVRQIDLLPTLLDALGQEIPSGVQGRSLLPALRGDPPEGPIAAISQLKRPRGEWESVVEGDWKLIRTRAKEGGAERVRLYDLASDPHEKHDVAAEHPVWRGYLLSLLAQQDRLVGSGAEAQPAPLDPELRKRLEALGYL